MQNEKYLIGSRSWFEGKEGFNPHDIDYISFVDKSDDLNFTWKETYFHDGIDDFTYVKYPPEKMLEMCLRLKDFILAGAFLHEEIANLFNISIEQLPLLRPIIEISIHKKNLKKHDYVLMILDFIVQNNSWDLTPEQLDQAYQNYLDTRRDDK